MTFGITSGITKKRDELVSMQESGDHDKFAHYAEKDEITRAMVEGVPIVAMCGKIWVPTRAPDGFPVCPKCKEMHDQILWLERGLV